MTGEKRPPRAPVTPQPGGRAPAPGRLAVVQAFINTHFDLVHRHGAEILQSPAALERWLRGAGLLDDGAGRLARADLARALAVRERLRDLAGAGEDRPGRRRAFERLGEVAGPARAEVRFTAAGPQLLPALREGADGAIGGLLAITAEALADGSWERLKICPGDHCGWAFFDHSRNRAGRWCSMAVCGGRVKARTHYRRRRTREV
jgi:predicted RNA-binding Zn ribbon-like protein